jgi:hypothetical protein
LNFKKIGLTMIEAGKLLYSQRATEWWRQMGLLVGGTYGLWPGVDTTRIMERNLTAPCGSREEC